MCFVFIQRKSFASCMRWPDKFNSISVILLTLGIIIHQILLTPFISKFPENGCCQRSDKGIKTQLYQRLDRARNPNFE